MGVKVRERNGAWWLFIDHQGRRKAKRVGVGKPGKKAAQAAAVQIQAKLAQGDVTAFEGDRRAGVTFAALAEEWLTKYPLVNSISLTTLENYTSFTRRHLIPYFGTLPVSTVTPETVEDFIAAKRKPGGSTRFGTSRSRRPRCGRG